MQRFHFSFFSGFWLDCICLFCYCLEPVLHTLCSLSSAYSLFSVLIHLSNSFLYIFLFTELSSLHALLFFFLFHNCIQVSCPIISQVRAISQYLLCSTLAVSMLKYEVLINQPYSQYFSIFHLNCV